MKITRVVRDYAAIPEGMKRKAEEFATEAASSTNQRLPKVFATTLVGGRFSFQRAEDHMTYGQRPPLVIIGQTYRSANGDISIRHRSEGAKH